MALSTLWGICEVGMEIDQDPEMESDNAGVPEELEKRSNKQEETNESGTNGKGNGKWLL